MIIVQTPLRISFFGGGTDFPSFFMEEGGCVLSSAIDKYIFVTVKKRFDRKLRIGYTQTEMVDEVSQIHHEMIREALLRERYRGGQAFYVVPRIEDLAGVKDFLDKNVPEMKVAVAHGQMPPTVIEDIMSAFYDGKYDILLSTTIIESGLSTVCIRPSVAIRLQFGIVL